MPDDLESRVARLEAQVVSLEKGRSGKKGLPILVSIEGVCGVDPDSDSASCPHASLYRRQKGCKGDACMRKASEYYAEYRAARGQE